MPQVLRHTPALATPTIMYSRFFSHLRRWKSCTANKQLRPQKHTQTNRSKDMPRWTQSVMRLLAPAVQIRPCDGCKNPFQGSARICKDTDKHAPTLTLVAPLSHTPLSHTPLSHTATLTLVAHRVREINTPICAVEHVRMEEGEQVRMLHRLAWRHAMKGFVAQSCSHAGTVSHAPVVTRHVGTVGS